MGKPVGCTRQSARVRVRVGISPLFASDVHGSDGFDLGQTRGPYPPRVRVAGAGAPCTRRKAGFTRSTRLTHRDDGSARVPMEHMLLHVVSSLYYIERTSIYIIQGMRGGLGREAVQWRGLGSPRGIRGVMRTAKAALSRRDGDGEAQ